MSNCPYSTQRHHQPHARGASFTRDTVFNRAVSDVSTTTSPHHTKVNKLRLTNAINKLLSLTTVINCRYALLIRQYFDQMLNALQIGRASCRERVNVELVRG